MFLLSTVESYLTAIDGLGWPSDKYGTWLAGLLAKEILQDMSSGSS